VSAERRLFDSSAAPGARRRGAGLAPGVVDDVQRGRIFEALLAAAEDREIGEIAVNHILQHAGMSARTFHAYFETREDCLRAAYLAFAERLGAELAAAWAAQEAWPSAALAFAAAEPLAARFLALGVLAAGPEALAAQAESIDRLAAKLREGRDRYPAAVDLARHTEWVLLAGLIALVAERLPELEPELVELALAPCLGVEKARELARSSAL
jgi:AcrR family transcriptional regulator